MTLFPVPFWLNRRLLAFAGTAALIALVPGTGMAEGTTVEERLTETGQWSSNPLLLSTKSHSLWGAVTTPSLTLANETPTVKWTWENRIDQNAFNSSKYNSTDLHSAPSFDMQNERWNFGLKAGIDYDTTRTSEDVGFSNIDKAVRHTGLSFAPKIVYALSPVSSLGVAGSVISSRYFNRAYTDYATYTITPSYTRKLDPLNSAIVNVQVQRYQTTRDDTSRYDSANPSAGWETVLSPSLKANIYVGAQTLRQYSYNVAVSPWQWQYTFSGGLNYKSEQDTIDITTSRAQYPYGNGTQALQTALSVSESHAINSAISLNLGGSVQSSTYPQESVGNVKTMLSGNLGATYHATDTVDLTTRYEYRHKTVYSGDAAHDHAATLNLVLHPQTWKLGL